MFETAFKAIPGSANLPSELTYQRNGLVFGNRLVRDTGNVVLRDPHFRTDLINFIHNCTMYDLIDGTIDPATFARSASTASKFFLISEKIVSRFAFSLYVAACAKSR